MLHAAANDWSEQRRHENRNKEEELKHVKQSNRHSGPEGKGFGQVHSVDLKESKDEPNVDAVSDDSDHCSDYVQNHYVVTTGLTT